jgi:3-mercaptopyruvate sulfurtransferase SseA
MLKRRGIEKVRVLAGGLQAWLAGGFPVETLNLKVLK